MRKGRFIRPFLHVKNYTPAEKLAKDVLQVGEDGRYLLVNKECQKDFIEEVKNTLNNTKVRIPLPQRSRQGLAPL